MSDSSDESDYEVYNAHHSIEDFLRIVSYRSDQNGDFQNRDYLLNADEIISDTLAKKIDNILSKINLDVTHESVCNMPHCRHKENDSFWRNIEFGCVKICVIKYLIEKKYIDFTNEFTRRKLLVTFSHLLEHSGVENSKGMSDRIHITTEYFFKILSENMLDDVRTFRDNCYGQSLLHYAFYGYDINRMKIYINRLIDLGVNLYLTHNPPVNDSDLSQHLTNQINVIINSGYVMSENLIGQSPIALAASDGFVDILKRLIAIPGADQHLKSYYAHYYETDYSKESKPAYYSFRPIIASVLAGDACLTKDVQYLNEVAECIRVLIDAGADPLLPILYPMEEFQILNISDFLAHFEYIYPESPVFNAFENITLPNRLDPNGIAFDMMLDRQNSFKKNQIECQPYENVFKKYLYVKNPAFHQNLIEELESSIPTLHEFNKSQHEQMFAISADRYQCDLMYAAKGWRYIPEVNSLIKRKATT